MGAVAGPVIGALANIFSGTAGVIAGSAAAGTATSLLTRPKVPKASEAAKTATRPAPPSPSSTERLKTAETAAQRERRRARGGRSSTILTGAAGLGSLPEANRQSKTILGY